MTKKKVKDEIKVLFAEDELWLPEKWFQRAFNRAGFKLVCAEDVDGLLKQGPHADVLVVDARLSPPGCGLFKGVDGVVGLVERGEVRPTVPIIFLSTLDEGKATRTSKLSALRNTRRYIWLTKPVDLGFLIMKIREEL
jgi:DNA-binding response OmpR family regulator